jgi:predicted nucleic acid-binding Zn ribbon protein
VKQEQREEARRAAEREDAARRADAELLTKTLHDQKNKEIAEVKEKIEGFFFNIFIVFYK